MGRNVMEAGWCEVPKMGAGTRQAWVSKFIRFEQRVSKQSPGGALLLPAATDSSSVPASAAHAAMLPARCTAVEATRNVAPYGFAFV